MVLLHARTDALLGLSWAQQKNQPRLGCYIINFRKWFQLGRGYWIWERVKRVAWRGIWDSTVANETGRWSTNAAADEEDALDAHECTGARSHDGCSDTWGAPKVTGLITIWVTSRRAGARTAAPRLRDRSLMAAAATKKSPASIGKYKWRGYWISTGWDSGNKSASYKRQLTIASTWFRLLSK